MNNANLINKKIVVKGTVSYSALSKKVTNQFDKLNGNEERFRLKLTNVSVVKAESDDAAAFVANKFYDGKDDQGNSNGIKYFDYSTTSAYSPAIFDKNTTTPVLCTDIDKEISKGQTILVSLQIFKPKRFNNLGLGLNAIQVQDLNDPATFSDVGAPTYASAFEF